MLFNSSWAKRLLVLAAISAASVSAISAPVTVNFEGAFDIVGPSQTYLESGFTFTPLGGDALLGPSFCSSPDSCITNNGTDYLTALNDAEVTISAVQAFSLTNFDASFFPSPLLGSFFTGLHFGLKLTGELWSGGPVEQIVELVEDIVAGDFLFKNYLGSANLSNLRSLTLSACFFDGASCVRSGTAFDSNGLMTNDMQFAIDNITFGDAAAVPEPGMLWLMLISLGAFAVARRRRAL